MGHNSLIFVAERGYIKAGGLFIAYRCQALSLPPLLFIMPEINI
ncbi:hypothetical protein DCCM_2257 [Desulfocucumis palustris]|uniref:Uncharacterized protein n=1 Tax=Desulfocucumis palustris TaxID=1898651 RepID=A0A2L2XAN8_9FIRM|nr:hypothetical protein DCCM_2257 [Desulfocucumis palustris]